MARIEIANLAELDRLAGLLAENLQKTSLTPLFLKGELGAGKTALVKSLISNFANADRAEPGSPSFTIYNSYPTIPPVFHCDLYRCRSDLPEELLEALEDENQLVIIEWAEYFPLNIFPLDHLDISFNLNQNKRLLNLTSHGENSKILLDSLLETGNIITWDHPNLNI